MILNCPKIDLIKKKKKISITGIWVLPPWSSSYCNKGKLACFRKFQEARTGILSSTLSKRTCMASCATSPNTDKNTLDCILKLHLQQNYYITLYISCGKKSSKTPKKNTLLRIYTHLINYLMTGACHDHKPV